MTGTEVIDAHQHFWQLSRPDRTWPGADLAEIYRDFLPADYRIAIGNLAFKGSVLVQSQPRDSDTDYLLQIAGEHRSVLAVVGWVDLARADAVERLGQLQKRGKFRGVRPMLQSIEDEQWILRDDCRPALEYLQHAGLSFDALIRPGQLPVIAELARRYPDLAIVLDHGAKPDIARDDFNEWARDIERVAMNANVYCKFSGLLTEATLEQCQQTSVFSPYVRHLYRCFGWRRLMWGSDWPVCNLRASLRGWYAMSLNLLEECIFEHEKGVALTSIYSRNARVFYRIE